MSNKKGKFEYVISACLLGIPCRWNGKSKTSKKSLEVYLKGNAIPVCPEIFGGLSTPRSACEIIGGDGKDVLTRKAKIVDKKGKDYSKAFVCGSAIALEKIVKNYGIKKAILKSGSPTCGAGHIFSGKFDGKKKKGVGVFAAMLEKNGVEISEEK